MAMEDQPSVANLLPVFLINRTADEPILLSPLFAVVGEVVAYLELRQHQFSGLWHILRAPMVLRAGHGSRFFLIQNNTAPLNARIYP
jgi:hypothetical protein